MRFYNYSKVKNSNMPKIRITEGEHGKFVFFWKIGEPGEEFCNWFISPFKHKGILFNCEEQHMMWEKAVLFKDHKKMAEILAEPSPGAQKSLGRGVKNFNQEVWEKHCYNLIKEGLRQKFEQHPELKTLLLSTGDAIMAEASPKDQVWGIGRSGDDPDAQVVGRWRGKNLLGKLLMELREEMRS